MVVKIMRPPSSVYPAPPVIKGGYDYQSSARAKYTPEFLQGAKGVKDVLQGMIRNGNIHTLRVDL
jgi:hypothetical protein